MTLRPQGGPTGTRAASAYGRRFRAISCGKELNAMHKFSLPRRDSSHSPIPAHATSHPQHARLPPPPPPPPGAYIQVCVLDLLACIHRRVPRRSLERSRQGGVGQTGGPRGTRCNTIFSVCAGALDIGACGWHGDVRLPARCPHHWPCDHRNRRTTWYTTYHMTLQRR